MITFEHDTLLRNNYEIDVHDYAEIDETIQQVLQLYMIPYLCMYEGWSYLCIFQINY